MFSFSVIQKSGKARLSKLTTAHGAVRTPIFMPVGTVGSLKGVTADQAAAEGVQMVLANTYHLLVRPGPDTVEGLGGVHRMMAWQGPILTDSGGYQVFSLADLRKIDDQQVVFKSHVDGSDVVLTPQRAVAVQQQLGADIIMQLDECPPAGAEHAHVRAAVERSAAWAALCREAWDAAPRCRASAQQHFQALFGIQQGGTHLDLRAQSAAALVKLDLPGYAIGGLSVGEGHEAMIRVVDHMDEQLPEDRPRYLMGVGEPRDILAAVLRGVDMFDCVLPTRNGRNAQAFTWRGRMRLRNAQYAQDTSPLEAGCDCLCCRNFSRGTIRHLFMAKEMLGPTLLSIHNLRFFARFMTAIRQAIADGNLEAKAQEWTQQMYPCGSDKEE